MMYLNARPAILFPMGLLAFIALITFWIGRSVQPELPKIDGSSRHDPDYIMKNFVTTQTDVNGHLRYKLAAIEMRHFPDDDTTELQRPRYTQFTIDKPYTQVEGLRGYVSSDGEEVQLVDNVKVTRQAFNGKGEMTVETDYLNIRPNEELVRTQSPVVIRQAPKTVIYATGMVYDKKKNTVTLLKKVRAHYEKPIISQSAGAKKSKSMKAQSSAGKTVGLGKATVQNDTTQQKKKSNKPKSTSSDARIRRRYE